MSPAIDAYVDALLDPGITPEPVPVMAAAEVAPAPEVAPLRIEPVVEVTPVAAPPVRVPPRIAPVVAPVVPERIADTAPPVRPASLSATHRWLRVAVGGDSYAIELLRVQEVGRTAPIVAMRGAAPSVLGAMNLRGRIVPVLDLGLWLGTARSVDPASPPDERTRIVVVERDNELIGALVTAVDDVVTLRPDRIEPPLAGGQSRAIVGVARVGAKPTVLLDAMALFG